MFNLDGSAIRTLFERASKILREVLTNSMYTLRTNQCLLVIRACICPASSLFGMCWPIKIGGSRLSAHEYVPQHEETSEVHFFAR